MRPIDNPDALHRMLQSVSKSWSAANAGSATAGTRSEPCLGANSSKLSSRNVTPVPNNSKNLQPKASRKAPFSSLKNCAALQQIAPVGPAPLPSRSIPRHIQIAMARTEAAENPIKEAVAKLESPVRTRPRKSFVNSGNNAMPPPPPPPNPLPSKQQPHFRSAYVCDLPASNMSFESASESQIEPVCKPVEHSERPEKGDVKDAEDSYDDLSFVDVDGLMDVDLEEPSGSSPAVEQHVPCTTQESKTMSCSQPALSGQAQERSAASAVQNPTPVIKRETFSSMFSTPIQVDVFAPKALGMRRVHSGPTSGRNASNSSASASGAKSGTAPPGSHSSTRGPKPFKVPWAHNETSVATLEPSVVPEVRKPTPKRRGIMDLDTSTDSSFSFDDMDVEVVEHLLSQIGA